MVLNQRPSEYRHVTLRPRRQKPWRAMVDEKYLGSFATAEEAAQAAADKLGQPKEALLRHPKKSSKPSKPAKTPKRSHRFVYWHRGESKWQV